MLDLGLYFVDVENQSLLASSLQTAYNLRALPSLVQRLLRDLCDAIEERIRNAFDLSLISKEFISKGMASQIFSFITHGVALRKCTFLTRSLI